MLPLIIGHCYCCGMEVTNNEIEVFCVVPAMKILHRSSPANGEPARDKQACLMWSTESVIICLSSYVGTFTFFHLLLLHSGKMISTLTSCHCIQRVGKA